MMSHAAKMLRTLTDATRRWLWRFVGRGSTFYRMHGRLMREVTLQQRANRKKNRKLAGLRKEKAHMRFLLAEVVQTQPISPAAREDIEAALRAPNKAKGQSASHESS